MFVDNSKFNFFGFFSETKGDAMLLKEIQFAGGSIPGTEHTMPGQPAWVNNHDAYVILPSTHCLTAVICDGCGSGEHSEVGAKLGSVLIARAIVDQAERVLSVNPSADLSGDAFCQRISRIVIGQLTTLAHSMGGSLSQVVGDYFLFTVVGAVVTDSSAFVFSLGDGMYAINGKSYILGPFSNNEPPYLMYALTGTSRMGSGYNLLVNHRVPAENFQSLLIGTDGVSFLVAASNSTIPGHQETIGPLSQFWEDNSYFENPDMIRRKLAIVSRERSDGKKVKGGPLKDDTTLVVVRRYPKETAEDEACMSL